jgi:signal transduction histidine kinase/ActR/RegA family two-component response regulator
MSRDGATLTIDPAQLVSMMFALLPVPVAITDSRGRVILCNSCFTDVFQGIPSMSPEPQREIEVPGRGTFQVETLPLTDQGYKIVFAIDVTDQAHLRERVARLEKMAAVGRVVTGVANELETPLADIASYAFLVERSSLTPELRQIVGTLLMRAERAAHLVHSLVAVGAETPRTTPFDLNTVVRNVVELRRRGQDTDTELTVDLDQNLPRAVGDPSLIEQVVLTLLMNAEDSVAGIRPTSGTIGVRTCLRSGRIQLHVSNNGPLKTTGRIFEPSEGGVGLNICAEIAKDHEGELYAWSSYDSGSTLTLELPPYTQESASGAGRRLKGKSVMVVDDEAHVADFVEETLTRCGALVDIAHSGSEAYERFKKQAYDLVICDRHMPGLNGQGLYRLVQDMDPDATQRFLFITSDAISADTRHFFSEHKVHFIRKPFNGQELLKTIDHLFSQDEPRDF